MKRMTMMVAMVAMTAMLGAGGAKAADAEAGKTKATSAGCAGCHGPNGEGVLPNTKLTGKSEAELAQALNDYKSGKRASAMMKAPASALSAPDIANLAAFYASKK